MGEPRSFDIDLLRSFLLIAGGVTFTQTAERVGRTQAAVTLQIKRLEAMVGHRLLDRSRGTGVRLTQKGERLALRARELVSLNDDIVGSLGNEHPPISLPFAGPDDRPSIAVLPFDDRSDGPGHQYFVDGIVDDLISRLSRIRWLVVVARNSSLHRQRQIRRHPRGWENIGGSLRPSGIGAQSRLAGAHQRAASSG